MEGRKFYDQIVWCPDAFISIAHLDGNFSLKSQTWHNEKHFEKSKYQNENKLNAHIFIWEERPTQILYDSKRKVFFFKVAHTRLICIQGSLMCTIIECPVYLRSNWAWITNCTIAVIISSNLRKLPPTTTVQRRKKTNSW